MNAIAHDKSTLYDVTIHRFHSHKKIITYQHHFL